MREIEPGRGVDRAERARRQDDHESEHAVDDGHRRPVGRAEQEATAAPAGLRASADDREVDRDHREHAGREVQGQSADENDREHGERPAAFEQAALLHAGFRVADELDELGRARCVAGRAEDREPVEERQHVLVARRLRRDGVGAGAARPACTRA